MMRWGSFSIPGWTLLAGVVSLLVAAVAPAQPPEHATPTGGAARASAMAVAAADPSSSGTSASPEAAPEDSAVESIEVRHPEKFPTTKVTVTKLSRQLTTSGAISWDVTRAVPVNALGGGRALEVKVRLGDDVVKDQILMLIDSPDLAQALADHRKAVSTERLASKAYARARLLFEHEGAAQKDVEQAADDALRAQVDREAAAQRVRLLGGHVGQVSPLIEVRAPISGTIVEQNVQRGTAVKSLDNAPNLFTVADLSRVWVLCDLYEENLSDVKLGDGATVTLNAFPTQELAAKVVQISRVLDVATRTAKVRLEVDNPDGHLRMGMFAKVLFSSSQTLTEASVPASSVLVLHDRSYVFRREGERRFQKTLVETGRMLGQGMQEVKSGLGGADEIVVDAMNFANTASAEDAK